MDIIEKRISEIEDQIASGDLDVHQVFTQMRWLVKLSSRCGYITRFGQIKIGDTLEIDNEGLTELHHVDDVVRSGTEGEEIILDRESNTYFITSMLLKKMSWVKQARIIHAA